MHRLSAGALAALLLAGCTNSAGPDPAAGSPDGAAASRPSGLPASAEAVVLRVPEMM